MKRERILVLVGILFLLLAPSQACAEPEIDAERISEIVGVPVGSLFGPPRYCWLFPS